MKTFLVFVENFLTAISVIILDVIDFSVCVCVLQKE